MRSVARRLAWRPLAPASAGGVRGLAKPRGLPQTSGGWRNRWRELARIRAKQVRHRKAPRGRSFKPTRLAEGIIAARDAALPHHEEQQAASGLAWRTVAASLIMRDPQLLELPEDWEVDMQKLGLQLDRDYRAFRPDPEALAIPEDALDPEKSMPYLYPFTLTPEQQLTDADKRGDLRSLQRRLTEPLYLIFKGKSGSWQFPQASHQEGEAIRATASRALATVVGTSVRTHPGGNFPLGFWWYAYPEKRQAKMKAYGAKVFFLRSTYMGGELEIRIPERVVDYAWVAPDELAEYFDKDLYDYVKHLL